MRSKVTKEHIDSRIANIEYTRIPGTTITHCRIKMVNGFSVTGESACVDPANFNKADGEKYARENAYNKLWALEGYLLAEERHNDRLDVSELTAGLSFPAALLAIKAGRKVARAGWNGKGMWIALSGRLGGFRLQHDQFWSPHAKVFAATQSDGCATVQPCIIIMKTAQEEIQMGWLASQSDMLASDWEVLP